MPSRSLLFVIPLLVMAGCADGFLTTQPKTIFTDDRVWTDPNMVTAVLADYYDRIPDYISFNSRGTSTQTMTAYDEALWSSTGFNDAPNQIVQYPFSRWASWGYGLIRDINLAIENTERAESPLLSPAVKEAFLSEFRFQRAWTYFDHVKRMGGVPIITSQLIYDFSGDASSLQHPRNTEAEVYDFIAAEMDAIENRLGNAGSRTRANRYTALALKSRAMLYAGSLARHNSEMPAPITLPGGQVGIPASRAVEYYTKSLDASRAIINGGAYSLYRSNPHPGENFYEAIASKSGNPEVIWAKDYMASAGKSHTFTVDAIPRSMVRDVVGGNLAGGAVAPSLNLVEAFDYIDGSPGALRGVGTGTNTAAGQADWIFYDRLEDIFAGKDGRLYGTVIYPGSPFAGQPTQMQAGVYVWNENAGKYDRIEGSRQSLYQDGGVLTGADGPRRGSAEDYVSATGFYLRKYLDATPAAATGVGSDMWWVRFRLGEIYLNAAEAAFELGLHSEALGYINTLRERAGFPPNSLISLTREKIRNERWAELAFEDHRVWDLRRWRIAHEVWDGTRQSTTANLYGLYPYRIVRPGHPNHGKYVFDRSPAERQTNPRFFRMGNYYSEISAAVQSNNPKLVPNPFH